MRGNSKEGDFDDLIQDHEQTYKPRHYPKNNNDFMSLDHDETEQPLRIPSIKQNINQYPQQGNNPKAGKVGGPPKELEEQPGSYFEQLQSQKQQNNPRGVSQYKQPQAQDPDEYGQDDFEQEVQEEVNYRAKESSKVYQYKSQAQPLKAVGRDRQASKSINAQLKTRGRPKQQSLYKSGSKESVGNKTHLSLDKSKPKQEGKFSAEVIKNFPEADLGKQTVDQVQKLNQKIRTMIRKLNSQLNQILNRVTLEQKKPQVSKKGTQVTQKQLEQAIRNNLKILERGKNELRKLEERVGEIKGESHQEQVTQSISELSTRKKENQKAIERMKVGININEKKQGSTDPKKGLEVLKSDLFNIKKEVEKHQAIETQMDAKLSQINLKASDSQKKLRDVVERANSKNVSIYSTEAVELRYKEQQQKEKNTRKAIEHVEVLYKSKGDIAHSENQRIRREISNYEAQIKDLYNQIVEQAEKSSILIEKERENPRLLKNVLNSLQMFSKAISNVPQLLQFDRSANDETHLTEPSGYSRSNNRTPQENRSKETNISVKVEKSPQIQERNSAKPNFRKEKPAEPKIWKEEGRIQDPKVQEKHDEKVINTLKPTFNIRKKNASTHEASEMQQPKGVSTPIAPKAQPSQWAAQGTQTNDKIYKPFTRLKRNSNASDLQATVQRGQIDKPPEPKNQLKDEVIEPAQIVPKKFMLKRRGNSDQNDTGYNPTAPEPHSIPSQANQDDPPTRPNPPETKPDLIGDQNSLKPARNQEVLPARVRNFQNRNAEVQPDPTATLQNLPQPSSGKLTPPVVPNPPRQKQGRIEKERNNVQGNKLSNIYSQAVDITNEFIKQPQQQKPKPNPQPRADEEQPDLNTLLGLSKNNRQEEEEDVVFSDTKVNKQRPKPAKQEDFFGFDL